jgi:hypothetical protein
MVIDLFAEQIRSRYFHEDLELHKHILLNDAFLVQIVLSPNGEALFLKLCRMIGLTVAKAAAAFERGKTLVRKLCTRLGGESLLLGRSAGAPPPLTAASPPVAAASDARPSASVLDYGALYDEPFDGAALLTAPSPLASDAALQEFDTFSSTVHNRVTADKMIAWWRVDAKEKFPHLRFVALAVYGTFPSSAESEREFSTAGKDATAARSSLRPAMLRILSYLSLNAQHLREVTRSDELVKKIPILSPKARCAAELNIEKLWAADSDDEADIEA